MVAVHLLPHLESSDPRLLLAADIFMQSVETDGNDTLSHTYEIAGDTAVAPFDVGLWT